MALTLAQAPAIPSPVNMKLVFTATSTNVANTGFRFKYTVTIDGTAHVVYVPPNPLNSGMLDIRPIIQKYVYQDVLIGSGSIFNFGTGLAYSVNEHNFKQVTVTILEAWEVAGVLTDDPDAEGSVGGNTYRVFAGSLQSYESNSIVTYGLGSSTARVLSDRQATTAAYPNKWKLAPSYNIDAGIYIEVADRQQGVLAFQNWANITAWQYTLYAGSSVIGTTTITVNGANGLGTAAITNTTTGIGYLAAYPNSVNGITAIQSAGLTLSGNPTWTHYAWTPVNGVSQTGYRYIFYRTTECTYDTYSLTWDNSRGGWDSALFTKRSTQTLQTEHKRYRKVLGNYNAATFSYTLYDRGLTDFNNEVKRSITITRSNMTASDYELFKSLATAQNIYLACLNANFDTTAPQPVVMTTTTYDIERMRRAGQRELTLTFEYANEVW